MAWIRSRQRVAVLVSLLALIVAGGQALAAVGSPESDTVPGVRHQLAASSGDLLPSERWGLEVRDGDGRAFQAVIGRDDRQQVTDTTRFPNSAVSYIEAWKDGKDFVFACSAAFVGPKVLLTAAHCLWAADFGGFPDGVALAPGLNGKQRPFGVAYAAEVWVPDGWIDAGGSIGLGHRFDYALIVLPDGKLGEQVGAFNVAALSDEELRARDFQPSTAGYPSDKPLGTQWFGTAEAFGQVRSDLLVHQIDVYQGQSGSPVWRGSDLTVVGVISFETTRNNYTRRITSKVLHELNSACKSLGCAINQHDAAPEPEPTATPAPEPTPTPSPTAPETPPQGDLTAFDRTYRRTDDPINAGMVDRTWIWGPVISDVTVEPYDDAPGGARAVRYHEKSRMEITAPDADSSAPWYVTNGLLARELVTGELQAGDERWEQREPAQVNVAGDPNDPDAPTYASFLELLGAPPVDVGAPITATVDRAGAVGENPDLAAYGVTGAQLTPETNHVVASVFWEFMNSSGVVNLDGAYVVDLLFESPYFATGLPITEAYWTRVDVGGTERLVLIQVFERRVLTYTPGNPPGWEVEAGNVGSHYHQWRYGG